MSYIGIGQTTITATLAADDKYSGAKAQYTLKVVEKSTDPDDYMSIKPKASTDDNGGSLSYTGNPIPIVTAGESSAGITCQLYKTGSALALTLTKSS